MIGVFFNKGYMLCVKGFFKAKVIGHFKREGSTKKYLQFYF